MVGDQAVVRNFCPAYRGRFILPHATIELVTGSVGNALPGYIPRQIYPTQ